MLIIAGEMKIDPEKREALTAPAVEMMRETRKEPGNIAYAFSLDLDDPSIVHVFEQWESQEALDAHFATPHMKKFRGELAPVGVAGLEVEKFQISSVGPLF